MVVFRVRHVALSRAAVLLPEELAVLPPEVLAVPVRRRVLLAVSGGVIGGEVYRRRRLAVPVADWRVPFAHAL